MLKLSDELHQRIHQTLLSCQEFDNNLRLQGPLVIYNRVFEQVYATREELVTNTIDYLSEQHVRGSEPALLLFLEFLRSKVGDELRITLGKHCEDIERDFIVMPPSQADYSHPSIPAPTNFPLPGENDESFLDRPSRTWLIRLLRETITEMSPAGRANLLRGCLSDTLIGNLTIGGPPQNAAEIMITAIEARDKLHPEIRCLDDFLHNLIDEGYCEEPVQRQIETILVTYNDARHKIDQNNIKNNKSWYPENALISEQFPRLLAIPQDELTVAKQLRAAKEHYSTTQTLHKYKINANSIVDCNLFLQKEQFEMALKGQYTGLFVFTVANRYQIILEEYILKSLLWKLQQHSKRQTEHAQHVYLTPELLDFSSPEQGADALEQEFEEQFSLTARLSDNPRTDLVAVIWFGDIAVARLKPIAVEFIKRLTNKVADTLREQERCLVLFWANDGFSSSEPLDVPTVLPTFERFDIDHLSAWLKNEIGVQLRSQQVPEPEIDAYRKEFLSKVTHYGGHLPATYKVLQNLLK